ncbi:MAG TPA: hypothetical protein VLT45_19875 [Kofleriaceae bacterium]|nr:hypothetical protein [Kofleriaceae bacterium]
MRSFVVAVVLGVCGACSGGGGAGAGSDWGLDEGSYRVTRATGDLGPTTLFLLFSADGTHISGLVNGQDIVFPASGTSVYSGGANNGVCEGGGTRVGCVYRYETFTLTTPAHDDLQIAHCFESNYTCVDPAPDACSGSADSLAARCPASGTGWLEARWVQGIPEGP